MDAIFMCALCAVTYVTALWLMVEGLLHEIDALVLSVVAAVGFIAFFVKAASG